MNNMQSEFIGAVTNPDLPVPKGIASKTGQCTKRFSVYRNNVIVSLVEALETAFPVVRKLVGEEFFRAMAGEFVRKYPPSSPLMMRFAGEFPDFLGSFEPVSTLPYLSDVSRIELGLRHSYHAADSAALTKESLADIDPARLAETYIGLAPSFMLLRSSYPVFSIWDDNTRDIIRDPPAEAQAIAITRKFFDPVPRLLVKGEHDFLSALQDGISLGDAFTRSLEVNPEYPLQFTLAWMLDTGAITRLGFEPQ